ncbi:MAG: SDR family NAD(P)-dependent oxidoreductase [Pseudomonadota bacterium]|nr:SDR family NAD(P)-dependent oxidoreductase [Pseudomonadota bacterium]
MNILIQGGGRGIGLALARRALAAGAGRLVITARNPDRSPARAELGGDGRVTFLPLDVTDDAGIRAAADEIKTLLPRLDRVICTSGILRDGDIRPEKRIADIDAEALSTLYRVNALGPVLLARELWPLLKGDHALQFSAISARVGSISDNRLGGWYGYRASKAALNQLMRTLSIELARANPNACVATLHPGTVDTDLSKPFQGNVPSGKLFTADDSAARLWQVLDRLTPADTGTLFAYDGTVIPY